MTWNKQTSSNSASLAPATSYTATAAAARAVGDIIMATITWSMTGNVPATIVVDDPSGSVTSYVQSTVATDSVNQQNVVVVRGVVTSPGTPQVRIQGNPTPGTTSFPDGASIQLDPFTGSDAASTGDGTNGLLNTPGGAGTDNINSGLITTATDGDLIYAGVCATSLGTDVMTKGTGFTDGGVTGTNVARSEYLVQGTHGAITPTFSSTSGGSFAVAAMAVTPAAGSVSPELAESDWQPLDKMRQNLTTTMIW